MMQLYFRAGFLKEAGGPGSGVSGDNTDNIDILEHSPLISIGKRRDFLKTEEPLETKEVSTSEIVFKGQHKYVPKKLTRMIMSGDSSMWNKPVQLLRDSKGNYHIIDGHHRVLAAIILGRDKILAEIYPSDKLEKRAESVGNLFGEVPHIEKGRGDDSLLDSPKDIKKARALGLLPPVLSDEPPRDELQIAAGNPYNDLRAF